MEKLQLQYSKLTLPSRGVPSSLETTASNQQSTYLKWKHVLDIALAVLAVVVLSPLLLLIALAIKLESKGPVIYKQTRLGKGGKPFQLLKFRTMYVDGTERLKNFLARNPEAFQEILDNVKKDPQLNRKLNEKELLTHSDWLAYWKLRRDPRITRVGKFLRRFSLDELPQLINVIRGEMSLVGPRPYMLHEIEEMAEFADKILSVKPGITGLWQVRGRASLTFRDRLWLETFYAQRTSLLLDLWIILKTIPAVISGRGAN